MITEWHYGKNSHQKYLTFQEIADICGCSLSRVERVFASKVLTSAGAEKILVNAGDVITFLLENSMPLPATLLPENCKKILVVFAENFPEQTKGQVVEILQEIVSEKYNVLIDQSPLGKFAELALLTFSPDIIVILAEREDDDLEKILVLTRSFPEIRTIIVSHTITQRLLEKGKHGGAPHLLCCQLPCASLQEQLQAYLRM